MTGAHRADPLPTTGADGWMPVDCHAHSTFSDGALTVPQVVELAHRLGVKPTVSDHVASYMKRALRDEPSVRAYLDALDGAPVLRSGEFCWHDRLWRELPAELVERMTHRVGSLHGIHLADGTVVYAFARRWPADLDADTYMDAHLASLEQFAREMPVDVLAHPTLLPTALRTRPIEELWTEEREERAVRALQAAGIAFEISNRYRAPERFVRRAHAAGVRLSLGSDGHTLEQVANIAWPLAVARAIGVRDEDLYDPERHGSRTGFFSRRSAA